MFGFILYFFAVFVFVFFVTNVTHTHTQMQDVKKKVGSINHMS